MGSERITRKEMLREEMADFRASYKDHGGPVPPRLCLNTGFMLRELLGKGLIVSDGIGLMPAGKAEGRNGGL